MKENWQKDLDDEQLLNRIQAYIMDIADKYSVFLSNMLSICIVEGGFRHLQKNVTAILGYNPYTITDYEGNLL